MLNAYPGQQLVITHVFRNPDSGAQQADVTAARWRITGPGGITYLDTYYYENGGAGGDLMPGQSFIENPRCRLLWTIPETLEPGRYVVDIEGTVNSYTVRDVVDTVMIGSPLLVDVSGELENQDNTERAVVVWVHNTLDHNQSLKLLKALADTLRADRQRLAIPENRIWAVAKHEQDATAQDITALDQLELKPGWTRISVSESLFCCPAVDRSVQAEAYLNSNPKYANPYYQDHLMYNIAGVTRVSPLATLAAGPLFYLYLDDPHWGCSGYGVSWLPAGVPVADPSGSVLAHNDSRRLEVVCQPDFRDRLAFYATGLPSERVALNDLISQGVARDVFAVAYNYLWFGLPGQGFARGHDVISGAWRSGGRSSYYILTPEVQLTQPAKTRRVMVGQPVA